MSISSRIQDTIESWTELWKERMRGFIISIVDLGLQALLHAVGKAGARLLKPWIEAMEATGEVPPEIQPILKELKEPTSQWQGAVAMMAGGGVMSGAIGTISDVMFGSMARAMMKKVTNKIMDVMPLTIVARRLGKDTVDYYGHMAELGFDKTWADWWWEVTRVYPTPGDAITWIAHEVYEPEMIAKYGLMDEADRIERDELHKIGMEDDVIDNYWKAHWVHASWGQVLDMFHRGLITYDDIWDWFRVVEIPPYWRDKLIGISWSLPNRIETRMMARYGLVDKAWLVEHLKRIGLHEDYRSIAADFMLAMGIRMDISARYSKGWLTADEVKTEIAAYGMSEDINDRLYKWIVKNVGPEKVEDERNLTKTEIYAGVKKGVISWEQGLELLQDMGYSREDAEYILEVRVGVLTGSPQSFTEFKLWTQHYRRAQGMEYKALPPELIEAGKALKEAEVARKEAMDKGIKEERLAPYEKAVSDASYRYRQLLTKWKEEKS